MEYITKRDMLFLLFAAWLEGQGYSWRTVKDVTTNMRRIMKEVGRIYITLRDTDEIIEKHKLGRGYASKLRRATRMWKEFIEWWEQEGAQDAFREWLVGQGYSRSTVKDYYYTMLMASGRRRATREELKRIQRALNAFKRFVADTYRKA